MEKKISDLDYSEIAAAINGYLNSEASIKQYVLSDLGSEVETIRKNWKGDASDKYIGKLESVYNDHPAQESAPGTRLLLGRICQRRQLQL